jgi:hypothetical protein
VPWHGSPSSDSPVGKGPVRGFPPTPGQPPPLYPPGQFSAWNRRGQARRGGPAAGPDQPGQARDGLPPAHGGSYGGYADDGPDDGQHYQPGYPALAVSDPAADVTSTQTWETVDGTDGHAVGTWTDPRGITGPGKGRPGAGPRGVTSAGLTSAGLTSAGDAVLPPGWPAQPPGTAAAAGPAAPAQTAPGAAGPAGTRPASARPGGRGPADTALQGTSPRSGKPGGSKGPGGTAGPGRTARRGGGSKRKGPSSAVLAVCAVAVLAVAAVTFLLFTARRQGTVPPAQSSAPPSPSASASASPTPTLGPFGHIATRAADPQPLTIDQLYPKTFAAGSATFKRTISKLQKSCTSALVGSSLQSAVKSAKCSQAVRATYVSDGQKVMGTIGVLNLSTSKTAAKAGHAAGSSDFIDRLRARKGYTHNLGKGTGIEEAETKGHYLILIWAQLTSTHKPKTKGERAKLDDFIKELFDKTANVSLSSRMVDGTP